MTNIGDRMLELLAFPLADPGWANLFHEHDHDREQIGSRGVCYTFPKLGVKLYTDESWPITIHFHIGATCTCDLPFGLRPDLHIDDLHRLLGPPHGVHQPLNTDDFGCESYHIPPYRVSVWYSLADEKLDNIRVLRYSTTLAISD